MKFDSSRYNIALQETGEFVYLYNSFSGALCKLEKETYLQISNYILDDNNKCKNFDELYKQGFIKPVDLNEFNKIVLTEREAVFSNSNRDQSYVIAPTLACNLNCMYCFEKGYREKEVIDDKTLFAVADYIFNRLGKDTKELHIGWFGGEPLLAYKQIVSFNEYLKPRLLEKSINYTASMITNGVLLQEEKIKTLAEVCNLKRVQITIDGTQEVYCNRKSATEKQFYDLLENIKCALDYVKIKVRLNCDGENFNDLQSVTEQLIDLCGNHKNLSIYLARLIDYLGCGSAAFFTQDDFDIKRIEFNKYVCRLRHLPYTPQICKYRKTFCGLFKLQNQVIGPNGELYKCEHHVGQSNKIIGNIKYGLNYNDTFMNFLENNPSKQCRECKIFPICLGGCPAQKMDLPEGKACFYSQHYIEQVLKQYIDSYQNKAT